MCTSLTIGSVVKAIKFKALNYKVMEAITVVPQITIRAIVSM